VQSLLAEPRPPNAPARVWRDWVLVGAVVPAAVLEGIFRDDVLWRPVSLVHAIGLAFTLLWRRTHPLPVVAIAFGLSALLGLAGFLIAGDGSVGLNTAAFVVLLPYSLVRWGSGREVAIGMCFVLAAFAAGISADFTGVGEAIAAFVFLMFPVALGAAVRFLVSARHRELDQVKLLERQQLARELHDTVAHHVSAITIRAQAGRVVAATQPGAAAEALAVIEDEALRTLAEMRLIVGVLRDGDDAQLAPQPGVAETERLGADHPRVRVTLSGELGDIVPSVGTALYRIAQESVTNAVRHARNATRIDVGLEGNADRVRLTVHDDGEDAVTTGGWTGYGLVGMTERAALLGGILEAGPDPGRGWTVRAVLPKSGPR
jgi:signal transduction histidine kinase